ncbi:MAG: NAD(P)-dependent oxidoreductase [Bacteriovorax sp.]|jgi:D-3-phosphoglycerate dehydrogenase
MKKGTQSKLTVKRLSTSPYFAHDFAAIEKNKIETLTASVMLPLGSTLSGDILITNTQTIVTEIKKEDLLACRLILHPNSGYDNFPMDFIKAAPFPIVIGNPIRAQAVANYILSALFSHYSSIPCTRQWDKSRKWPRKLLSELNILILGQGHIGTLLKDSLSSLAKNVRVYDPFLGYKELNCKNIDVVIPACGLNQSNHHFINKKFLSELNPDFLLINAARGGLVHTEELIEVLKQKTSAFAVLDVFEEEPIDYSKFKDLKNISMSSHIAGVYNNIDAATADFEALVINDWENLDKSTFEAKYKTMILKNRISSDGFLI